MTLTRPRRQAAARLARLLVLAAACGAALTLALLVRSCEREWPRFGAAPAPTADAADKGGLPTVGPLPDAAVREPADRPEPDTAEAARSPASPSLPAVDDLRSRLLMLPVEGVTPAQLQPSFEQARGERRHEAIDILAPTGTPVFAVEGGRIAKLFVSDRGGLTIYQFDPLERYAYYYAHLSRYASGLQEGQTVARGDVVGYVGVSGNAPPDTPHLHFAIFELGPEKQWWEGRPIDPFVVWRAE
jgi:murein DD-endopeptidase MepM/ murein hydrolase activator NlpD